MTVGTIRSEANFRSDHSLTSIPSRSRDTNPESILVRRGGLVDNVLNLFHYPRPCWSFDEICTTKSRRHVRHEITREKIVGDPHHDQTRRPAVPHRRVACTHCLEDCIVSELDLDYTAHDDPYCVEICSAVALPHHTYAVAGSTHLCLVWEVDCRSVPFCYILYHRPAEDSHLLLPWLQQLMARLLILENPLGQEGRSEALHCQGHFD